MTRCLPAAAVALAALASSWTAAAVGPVGRAEFVDRRNPPTNAALMNAPTALLDLGQSVFNTSWVDARTPDAARRDGLGPMFNAASCDACHNNGARGRGDPRRNELPNSFVMQLGGPKLSTYGHMVNTLAIAGFKPEARIEVTYESRSGAYADDVAWAIRVPTYRITDPGFGPLPPDVVLRPRIGPALFGSGLLERVPTAGIEAVRKSQPRAQRGEMAWHETGAGMRQLGRFGWQADAVSIQDQTERALEREMGLTSAARPHDDCTAEQRECVAAPSGGAPEVSDEFMHALVDFQRTLAVPARASSPDGTGAKLFDRTGCAVCHRPSLPVNLDSGSARIDAFTDLLLHDMGQDLADRNAGGEVVPSRWRTAPLWGLGHALQNRDVALMHDGRARSVEEAILWHGGQAQGARQSFTALPAADRLQLLSWIATL